MSAAYDDARQFVGIDLHRRRSVISRTDQHGQVLEAVRISNDPHMLAQVMGRAGEQPEVVLEATYGWYWAADLLTTIGANVHLAHPLGVKAFAYRRVTNDFRDAADLADLLRMGRLPEAWIAPPQVRDLRQLVRHRAKLVAVRSGWKCQVHPGRGRLRGLGADERPVRPGRHPAAGPPAAANHLCRAGPLAAAAAGPAGRRDRPVLRHGRFKAGAPSRLPGDPGDRRARAGAGRGAGRRDRRGDPLPRPAQLASWVGLTPRHHESDTHVHRGPITKQGSRLARWAAVEAVQRVGTHTRLGQVRERVAQRRGRNIGVVAAARELIGLVYYGLRDGHIRCLAA